MLICNMYIGARYNIPETIRELLQSADCLGIFIGQILIFLLLKSQHLKNVTLRGGNDANLTGNSYDNVLTGNDGDNVLTGGKGDDQLFGGKGNDTAVFSGAYEDYLIAEHDGFTTVTDKRVNRDGIDNLVDIKFLQFSNRKVTL